MRALVLSGGGAKGAYQVGAIRHLLFDREFHYDIVTGTSVGALNGALLCMYGKGEEKDASTRLTDIWMDVNNSRIRKKWYWGLLGSLPIVLPKWLGGKNSVYCTEPLQDLVRENLDPRLVVQSGKKLRVGAVSLHTGERRVWTEGDVDQIKDAVLASSAFPMFFEPIEIDGQLYVDDGVREIAPIEAAIRAGANEIHVISTGPDEVTGNYDPSSSGIALGERVLSAMSDEIEKWDFKAAELYNHLVIHDDPVAEGKSFAFLKSLRPQQSLHSDPLDFDEGVIRTNVDRGYADASSMTWE